MDRVEKLIDSGGHTIYDFFTVAKHNFCIGWPAIRETGFHYWSCVVFKRRVYSPSERPVARIQRLARVEQPDYWHTKCVDINIHAKQGRQPDKVRNRLTTQVTHGSQYGLHTLILRRTRRRNNLVDTLPIGDIAPGRLREYCCFNFFQLGQRLIKRVGLGLYLSEQHFALRVVGDWRE